LARALIVGCGCRGRELGTALLAEGWAVRGTSRSEAGLAAIEAARPDLVLMDIQLPGKDGFELVLEIRRSLHGATRVVALTAHAMAGDRERAIEAGFDGYIAKPIDIRRFPDQIAQQLELR